MLYGVYEDRELKMSEKMLHSIQKVEYDLKNNIFKIFVQVKWYVKYPCAQI